MAAFKEKNVVVEFEGYRVDLFTTESGNLGMTVEKLKREPYSDDKSIDVFVDQNLKEVWSV